MRSRAPLALVLLLALGLVTAGCFSATNSNKTVTDAITLGVGTAEKEVLPAATASSSTATGETTGSTASTETTTGETTTGGTTSTGGGADFTAARASFKNTCGGCHTLKDAGTNGTVGPNLDDLKPDETTVANQIQNGGGAMPANLLQGADKDAVAKYVAAVAGKS